MTNSADSNQKPTDLDLHCLQRQGISGFSRTRVNKVEMVQCRAIRWTMLSESPHDSLIDMHEKLGWRSLEQR